MKKLALSWLCIILMIFAPVLSIAAEINAAERLNLIDHTNEEKKSKGNLDITSKSAVLIEGSTGAILYEQNKDEKLRPASITKVMTLLLIFEALEDGKIALTDEVSVSEHAASMGGSQVFLEPNEKQTVDTMIKCISISSANDAAVAMAEYIAGSEEEFVVRMNERAKELGMENSNFVNCCGLDVDNHYSSAYDVALMSRELVVKHPEISKYTTIWMDTITHVTKKGESEFGLSNTNKLVRTYDGITGLKTGSTSMAKYCLSATAKKNGMDLIGVVMGAPDHKIRFNEAAKLLDYGFANCRLFTDEHKDLKLEPVPVKNGVHDFIQGKAKAPFSYVCLMDAEPDKISREINIQEDISAPMKAGDTIGEITYSLDGKTIGSVPIVTETAVKKASFQDYFQKTMKIFFAINNFRQCIGFTYEYDKINQFSLFIC